MKFRVLNQFQTDKFQPWTESYTVLEYLLLITNERLRRGYVLPGIVSTNGWAAWSPTARIEGAHSDRAASASTGDRSGRPHSLPSLILLDLNLRGQDGCDFLRRLRSDPRFETIPTIIFTTSDDQQDLARCYASGANGYVVKPGIFAELVQCTGDICRYWIDRNRVISMIETPC